MPRAARQRSVTTAGTGRGSLRGGASDPWHPSCLAPLGGGQSCRERDAQGSHPESDIPPKDRRGWDSFLCIAYSPGDGVCPEQAGGGGLGSGVRHEADTACPFPREQQGAGLPARGAALRDHCSGIPCSLRALPARPAATVYPMGGWGVDQSSSLAWGS